MKYKKVKTIGDLDQNMNSLIAVLNHRVTKLEMSTRWIKWIISYIAVIITGVFIAAIGGSL